jgi:hypothetical protein
MGNDAAANAAQAPASATAGSGERIARGLTLAATIVGIFVTLNTLLSNCARDGIDRASGFRSAVQAEEKFWSGLYDQYLKAVSAAEPDPERRRTQLIAIAMLATHKNPDFDEFGAWYDFGGDTAAADATADLNRLRQVLHDALKDPRSSSPEVAEEIGFFLDEKAALRERATGKRQADDPPPAVTVNARAATVAAAETQAPLPATMPATGDVLARPQPGSRILAAGSATGWDVDVFWCMGGAEAQTFNRGLRIATSLAEAAQTNTPLAPGVSLGRIRLRSLPVAQQQGGYFYTNGNAVVADSRKGESEAAQALGRFVQVEAGTPLRQVTSTGVPTTWYLSVFVCPPRASAPAVAAAATAGY